MISPAPAANPRWKRPARDESTLPERADEHDAGRTGTPSATTLRWPPDRFYWAVLDAPLRRPGPLGPGLLLDLQDQVPLPVEDLHAVGLAIEPEHVGGGRRTLVCAAPRGTLHGLPPDVYSLAPLAMPEGLAPEADSCALNLLVGDFEPRSQRRGRTRTHAIAMAATLVVAGLLALGFSRRATMLEQLASAPTGPGTEPGISRADLNALRAFAARAATEPAPIDATGPLAAALRAWPPAAPGRPRADVQSLSVDSRRIALTVSVDGDPGEFLATLESPLGFVLEQPGISTSDNKARLALTFTRIPAAGESRGGAKP